VNRTEEEDRENHERGKNLEKDHQSKIPAPSEEKRHWTSVISTSLTKTQQGE